MGIRRAPAGISEDLRRRRRLRKGGEEEEGRSRRRGGVGAAAAERLLTMDVERSAIRLAVCMISSSDKARRRFFAAPVGVAVETSPTDRAVATHWTGWRGQSPSEWRVKSAKLEHSKSRTKIPYDKLVFRVF